MKLAYLQADEPLQRKIYIEGPAVEFHLEEYMALQLIKPLYGLSNSGDLWYRTPDTHNKEDLKLLPAKIDPLFYLYFDASKRLIGMNRSYVDDLQRPGNFKLKRLCETKHQKLETTLDEDHPFSFAGSEIRPLPDDYFTLNQSFNLEKIEILSDKDAWNVFASRRTMLAWLANSRPDLCVEISHWASITKDKYNENSKKYIKRLTKAITYAHSYPTQLRYLKLDVATLRIVGCSDAAFASNDDLFSQLDRIIFLVNAYENAAPIAL